MITLTQRHMLLYSNDILLLNWIHYKIFVKAYINSDQEVLCLFYSDYKFEKSPSANLSINPLYVSYVTHTHEWQTPLHTHPYTELIFLTHGEGVFSTTDEERTISKNQLVIINPYIQHIEKASGKDPTSFISIGFRGLSFTDNHSEYNNDLVFFEETSQEILFLLKNLGLEVLSEDNFNHDIGQKIIELVLLKLQQQSQVTSIKEIDYHTKKEVHRIKKYIQTHFREVITLDKLAEISNLNKYYLSHLFKNETGYSPIDFLLTVRLNRAVTLLKNTDYPISEIAAATGFSSQSFFNQRFKEVYNTTPSKFRKHSKEA